MTERATGRGGAWLQPGTEGTAVPSASREGGERERGGPEQVVLSEQRRQAEARHRTHALLQIWLSPAFPVGGFAYSHGLEKAVEHGWIKDRASLETWLADLVSHGSQRNDLILLAAAWRAATARDQATLRDTAELSAALHPSRERHLEATQQGGSFIAAIETAWPADALPWATATGAAVPTYCTAVGFTAAAHAVPLDDTLAAYAVAVIGALTSAAIRLGIVGQTDAQRVIAGLLPLLTQTAHEVETSTIDELGGAAWRSDIAAQQHETQTTRLFRS